MDVRLRVIELQEQELGDDQVGAVVVENNVVAYVLERARTTSKAVPFDELMAS